MTRELIAMLLVAASIAVMVGGASSATGPTTKDVEKNQPQVSIYLRSVQYEYGQSVPIVMEIMNNSDQDIVLFPQLWINTMFAPPPVGDGPELARDAADDLVHAAIILKVSGVSGKSILGTITSPDLLGPDRGNVTIGPRKSILRRINLPGKALLPGECRIQLRLTHHGEEISSDERLITCTATRSSP